MREFRKGERKYDRYNSMRNSPALCVGYVYDHDHMPGMRGRALSALPVGAAHIRQANMRLSYSHGNVVRGRAQNGKGRRRKT